MGCVTCTQMCGSQKDTNSKRNSQFITNTKNKYLYLKKIYSSPQQKAFFQQYITQEQGHILMHAFTIEQTLKNQNILLPEAGQLAYLTSLRRTVWKLYTFDCMVFQDHKRQIIHKYVENPSELNLSAKTEQRFYQIGLDIKRTFPLVKHLNRQHLDVVLKNLTLYFDGVGYTQGMNFMVGFLLLCGFQPRQAYYMFIHLSYNSNFLMIRNFNQGFKNIIFMIKVFQDYMDEHQKLKSIKQKVDHYGLTSYFYSFSWFLCYFLYNLNPKCCVLIWDYLFTNVTSINIQQARKKCSEQKILQKEELELFILNKQKQSLQHYEIIFKQRGSIINLLCLSFQLMEFLSDHIAQTSSAQQLMGILRNQSLMQRITPQIIEIMILKLKNDTKNLLTMLNWKTMVDKMKDCDKQLYDIQVSQIQHRNFMQECLGLRRKYKQQTKQNKKQTKQVKQAKQNKQTKNNKQVKQTKQYKDIKDNKQTKQFNEPKQSKQHQQSKQDIPSKKTEIIQIENINKKQIQQN